MLPQAASRRDRTDWPGHDRRVAEAADDRHTSNRGNEEGRMSRRLSARWLSAPVFGWRDIGVGDLTFAALVSLFAVGLSSGLTSHANPHRGVAAALAVLLMTAPVAFARRSPLPTAAVLAGGAAFNWLVIGHQIRCGATLPAVFYAAFMVGSRLLSRREVGIGAALVAANVICQCFSDPKLGPAVSLFLLPIALGFGGAGRLLHGRNAAAAALRTRTAELREQREQNAQLAVAAEHARITDDLDSFLQVRVGQIAAAAATGRDTLGSEPDQAQHAFVEIQDTGRETLAHMRGVVAGLRDNAPTEPQPVLAQLDRLLSEALQAQARLQVTGDPRLLPPGVELSGYRIVEHLLVALEDDPNSRIEVEVEFGPEALALTVVGPSARRGDVRPALAAATERAALHGGTVRTKTNGGLRETVVRLPLTARHA
jgi:signal transduction histidine kinase